MYKSPLNSTDDRFWIADEHGGSPFEHRDTWKILIIDGNPEVHAVIRTGLINVKFDEKPLCFFNTASEKEAKQLLLEQPDVALIVLGRGEESIGVELRLLRYIRQELNNSHVRIILLSPHSECEPEEKMIVEYDINAYMTAQELTSQKLFSTLYGALRSYRDIMTIELNRKGMEKIIEASGSIFKLQSMRTFASGILTQLTALMRLNKNALYCRFSGFAAMKNQHDFYILAATGDFSQLVDQPVQKVLSLSVRASLEQAVIEKRSLCLGNRYVGYFQSLSGTENVVYLEGAHLWNEWERNWVELFCSNVGIAFDNISLNDEIEATQREIIFTLGGMVEARSKETGHHVKRVAECSSLLARLYGLSSEEAELLRLASPMHDVGKVAVEDAILNKPGRLTREEFNMMKSHTVHGFEMLCHSKRKILQTAAWIALQHHEKFNGQGYPYGLRGDKIHIHARITAVADVFDALSNDRCYRPAWPMEKVVDLFCRERGEHFDPDLVELLIGNLDRFIGIQKAFPDG
ncbi:DUF3369 domain-containing protein [Heliobacillus mobilis]|uniref:DUF3369 domain-containing protein n=1 Tax=Heliobacterium mobile TaxID=28064 RepID=Q0PIH3_HELMO|nr:DUF3369 domain-containing protein [Heliobacterium mobile]ABH04845.1 RpfG family response regulator [Heliobacterium mobile]MTV50935.1 DUF3369 domain-containing protein [Heliobacterium mobile]